MSARLRAAAHFCAHASRLISVLGAVAVLAGCNSAPSRSPIVASDADGAVFFKVTRNHNPDVWDRPGALMVVRRIADASDPGTPCYWLRASGRGLSEGTFYAGALPTGTYEFPNLGLPGDKITNGCDGHGPAAARFAVAKGRLSYLGSWLETRTSDRQHNDVFVVDDTAQARIAQSLPPAFPELARFATVPTIGFVVPRSPQANADSIRGLLKVAFGAMSPAEDASGTWFYGTRSGGVRIWRKGSLLAPATDSGYRVSLEAALALPNGDWLVGGEQSTLLHSRDQGATWQLIGSELPYGLVVGLAAFHDDVMVVLLDGTEVRVYRSDASLDSWKNVANFHSEFTWFTGVPNVRPNTGVSGQSLVVSLPSRRVGIYDMATGESVTRDLPGAIQLFGVSADGGLHCTCAPVIVMNPYESHDLGKTWTSSTYNRYSTMPAMRDKMTGIVWTRDGIDRTRDGGRTWTHAGKLSDVRLSLFYSADGKRAFASDGGSLWETYDDGGTWRRAFQTNVPPWAITR